MARPSATPVPSPDGLLLQPFRAERFAVDAVGDLADVLAPPYDVIDAEQQAALEACSPFNVVRLTLPREEAGASRYDVAARTLADWRARGVLARDAEPAVYVYEESVGDHVQRGLVGAVGLAAHDAGIILPHENTMAGPVADRLALTASTQANLEPIFLVYDGGGAASQVVTAVESEQPLLDLTAGELRHRLWAITDREALARIADDLRSRRATIADGHHRYATYLSYQQDRHAAGAGVGPWDYGLALLVDTRTFGPEVHAIHRVVPGLAAAEAAERAKAAFARVEPLGSVDAAVARLSGNGNGNGGGGATFALVGDGGAWLVTEPRPEVVQAELPSERSAAWRGLDVAIAHHVLIRRAWGLDDTEKVVDFEHDVASAVRSAAASHGTALLLKPTPVAAVAAVAAAGERMPRKSTLFTPKPATGLLIRPLD